VDKAILNLIIILTINLFGFSCKIKYKATKNINEFTKWNLSE